MKVFSGTFQGHYPPGTAAIIFADSAAEAKLLLLGRLQIEEPFLKNDLDTIDVKELDSSIKDAHILLNGDY